MLVIINADDLGTTEQINDEIFSLMESGDVTSSTIIANAPAFAHAAEQTRRFPGCSFGVHLNLTTFPPLASSRALDPILDEDGHLSRKLLGTPMTASLRDALLQELTLQVKRVIEAGIPISHFDSHQHIHTIPKLFPILKALQRKFAIRKVRTTINFIPSDVQMAGWRSLRKLAFRLALRHIYATTTPDGLGDFRDFHRALMAGRLPRFRILELMVHPGSTSSKYNDEVALLRSSWRQLLPAETKLGSYFSV